VVVKGFRSADGVFFIQPSPAQPSPAQPGAVIYFGHRRKGSVGRTESSAAACHLSSFSIGAKNQHLRKSKSVNGFNILSLLSVTSLHSIISSPILETQQ